MKSWRQALVFAYRMEHGPSVAIHLLASPQVHLHPKIIDRIPPEIIQFAPSFRRSVYNTDEFISPGDCEQVNSPPIYVASERAK
jgi:hypothetical protein